MRHRRKDDWDDWDDDEPTRSEGPGLITTSRILIGLAVALA